MPATDMHIYTGKYPRKLDFAFGAGVGGEGAPSPAWNGSGVNTPRATSDACHVCLYRSPDNFWVPFVQFQGTFALVHN